MVEMTRRPILIGTAAIFALILTAGLAYSSARMQDTHPRHNQSVHMVGTHMNPGYGGNHQGQGWLQGPTVGNDDAWMGNHHNRQGGSWARVVGSHRNGTHDGYRYDHRSGAHDGYRYGSHDGSDTYDHHNGSSGNGDRHDHW